MISRVPIRRCGTILIVAALLAGCPGLAGCSGAGREKTGPDQPGPDRTGPDRTGPRAATRLTARLVPPDDIVLEWQANDPDAAGRIVEFATEPNGRYTILEFVPPTRTTYTHPDLMPATPFYYRVRPVYGPASGTVEVTLPEGGLDGKAEKDDHAWAVPQKLPGPAVATRPIRGAGAATAAAPTDLKVKIMHANGVRLTWTDRASDEEGYLIEVKPTGRPDFGVAMVVDPDVNSVGVITLPDEKSAVFRVRAFYYGDPSNLAYQKTRPEAPA